MRVQTLIWRLTALLTVLLTALLIALSIVLPGFAFGAPEIGDPAPDFSMQGSDGNTYSLQQLVGSSGIVIAFFPKAFTGG